MRRRPRVQGCQGVAVQHRRQRQRHGTIACCGDERVQPQRVKGVRPHVPGCEYRHAGAETEGFDKYADIVRLRDEASQQSTR